MVFSNGYLLPKCQAFPHELFLSFTSHWLLNDGISSDDVLDYDIESYPLVVFDLVLS
jgi:hypothetical protein